jgi:hypothetical protein
VTLVHIPWSPGVFVWVYQDADGIAVG